MQVRRSCKVDFIADIAEIGATYEALKKRGRTSPMRGLTNNIAAVVPDNSLLIVALFFHEDEKA